MAWMRNEPDPNPTSPATPSPSPAPPTRPQASGRSERAVIGPSISIKGDIKGEEDLTVLGKVQGTIDVKNNSVTVGQTGQVKADLHADLIVVEGRVEGNLFGNDQIILRSTANVQGNLTAPRVALEDGAQFKGAIDMEPVRKSGGATGAGGTASGKGSSGASGAATGSTGSGSGSASGKGATGNTGASDKSSSSSAG
jgi:cytoskeletal protein CcmA (bactofilin family)